MACNSCGMDLAQTSDPTPAAGGLPAGRARYRFLSMAYFLSRPVLIGLLAVLSSVVCCQAYAQSVSQSYEAPRYGQTAASAPHAGSDAPGKGHSRDSEAVPLLFLSVLGLAGMALSRIRSSKEPRD